MNGQSPAVAIAETLGPALTAYAATVTRDRSIAAVAVRDAVVIAGARNVDPADLPMLLALTRNECLRQLRARLQFVDTAPTVDALAADPLDALCPGDRDALALALRDDTTPDTAARAMGVRVPVARSRVERATGAWMAATSALLLIRDVQDSGTRCPGLTPLLVDVAESDGQVTPGQLRIIAAHARTCSRCQARVSDDVVQARRDLALVTTLPAPDLPQQVEAEGRDPDRVEQLLRRAGAIDDEGYPVPLDSGDRDTAGWFRAGAIAAVISATLLLVGMIVLIITAVRHT